VVLLALLFIARPGANRLRTRIVVSISTALGRPVEVSSVKLRFLPQPGFDLENFVVHDDPAFGAEPMLRAQDVTALLRIASLLRGRVEIATLSLTEPSLNLARSAEGHWNLETLIERAERIPVAPTSKASTERRPGFPYIEAKRGRINFKLGAEKKRYALTDADFALWQDSENTWGVRLEAHALRTDLNLSDTGIVRVNGSWQRAATLHDTPVHFNLQWDGGQLGQLTKLVSGNDKGWRGSSSIASSVSGTPASLTVQATASIEDFRRYDVMGGGNLRLAAECSSHYNSLENTFSDISCRSPVGDATVTLAGKIANPLGSPGYELAIAVNELPIQSLVTLFRHAKLGIPEDVTATGNLRAQIKLARLATGNAGVLRWEGKGETSGFRLKSILAGADISFGSIPLVLTDGMPGKARPHLVASGPTSAVAPPIIDLGPSKVILSGSAPLLVRGRISRVGYDFNLQGDVQLQRLLQAGRTVGLRTLQTAAEGSAKVDLKIAGGWQGFAAPQVTGVAQLHSIRAAVRGVNTPVEIASANLVLSPERVNVQNLSATLGGTAWRGSMVLPRPCIMPAACAISFDLHADEIAVDRLNQTFNPNLRTQPWYRFLSSTSGESGSFLRGIDAAGKLTADTFTAGRLAAHHLSANAGLNAGILQLSMLRAEVLGGKHEGDWKADFTARPPQYSGHGTLDRVSLTLLAATMRNDWITGSARASYRVAAFGFSPGEITASAKGTLQVDAWDGTLPHLVLPEDSVPVQVRRLVLHLSLQDSKLEIQEGNLQTTGGRYQLSGEASLNQGLNVKLSQGSSPGLKVTGTLAHPHVEPATPVETRAASLKP
jgi:hypothetical protein